MLIFTFPWGWGMPPHPPSTLPLQLGWLLHTQIVCNCGSGTTVWSGCNSTCMGGGRREEGAWGGREWGREWGSMQCKVPISDLPSNWSVLSQERKSGLCRYVAWQHCHNRVVLGCISAHTRVAWGVLRLVAVNQAEFLDPQPHGCTVHKVCQLAVEDIWPWHIQTPILLKVRSSPEKFFTQILKSEEHYESHQCCCTTRIWGPNQTRGVAKREWRVCIGKFDG